MKHSIDKSEALKEIYQELEGEFYYDEMMRVIYATDASVYRELPLAVAIPKNTADLKKLIQFAQEYEVGLIPRSAGTSLAGQVVGDGIIVDVSKYFTEIIEFNKEEKWIKVQPGIVRDVLNDFLKPHGLFFSPITSTANRATIGGMVGNNSSGTTSIVYGSTRDHVIQLKVLLSDGTEAIFGSLSKDEFIKKTHEKSLEASIYKHILEELSTKHIQDGIKENFPKQSIHRRNTGYAVDYLLKTEIFTDSTEHFDFCKLLCGSEGTLAFTTEITLHLDDLQAPHDVIVAAHFDDIFESLRATQLAMAHKPDQCELMDKIILDCTKENIKYRKNRWFLEGDPEGVLMVEFRGHTLEEATSKADELIQDFKKHAMGYAYPVIPSGSTMAVRDLRKAGLGLLANIPGDEKAVACIEDTAVALEDLAEYIEEMGEIMKEYGQRLVVYAHAGAGEIHLRPILNLKTSRGVNQFYRISEASARLVKKYGGSLSGEHGDGRLRGGFIAMMVGDENYRLFQRIKKSWDPKNIFNPNKIVDTPRMNTSLRYQPEEPTQSFDTVFDFSKNQGILRAAEKCNGSGDCRKLPVSGGTMCPSYQATRNEKDTTRARANVLREFLTQSDKKNAFNHKEIKEVMDLCLSCKGCTSECPSNVDMSVLKAEFLHQYFKSNGVPLRARAFAYINKFNELGGVFPSMYNFTLTNPLISGFVKGFLGVSSHRSLPTIQSKSLKQWQKQNHQESTGDKGAVILFCDEFTNWNDTHIGIKSVKLLNALGYKVQFIDHAESGRAAISKGLLLRAKKLANQNVQSLQGLVSESTPLIGIEPSAILSFRDEYPRLVDEHLVKSAREIADHTYTIEEFLYREFQKGILSVDFFTKEKRELHLHGHCHQKSLGDIKESVWLLSLPENYHVSLIPSGCCGMAGSFGYEKEHYEVSQQIGELVLFPSVRKALDHHIIVAAGTSCRHQIKDATLRKALHPVEVLFDALK